MLESQYGTSANLETRLSLHDRCSTNRYGWQRFVFDHFRFPPGTAVLELGCGTGKLWSSNLHSISADCQFVLSDASMGMVDTAREQLAPHMRNAVFVQIDAQAIPYAEASFDMVIANHMLNHVPDIPAALREMRRVLKPGGYLYTATNGEGHLKELITLLSAYDERIDFGEDAMHSFTLENGPGQLAQYLSVISVHRYLDHFLIDDPEPLIAYIMSSKGIGNVNEILDEKRLPDFRKYVNLLIRKNYPLRIGKDPGMIVSYRA